MINRNYVLKKFISLENTGSRTNRTATGNVRFL